MYSLSMSDPWHTMPLRSKGQGHKVIKCTFGISLQVNITANSFVYFLSLSLSFSIFYCQYDAQIIAFIG